MPIHSFDGATPQIADDVFIAPGAQVIGNVRIGAGSSIFYNVVLRGDIHSISVGERTNIQDGTVIHCTGGYTETIIGDDVTVGHLALLHGCTVEDGAFIGMKACVMDKAVVETGGMVAAGALVPPGKVVKAGEVWAGNPARFLREIRDQDRAVHQHTIPHYMKLAQQYMSESGGKLPDAAE